MSVLFLAGLTGDGGSIVPRLDKRSRIQAGRATIARGALGGRDVVIAAPTAIGPKLAALVARDAIDELHPEGVVTFGLAQGLSGSFQSGDVIVATEIIAPNGGPRDESFFPPAELLSRTLHTLGSQEVTYRLCPLSALAGAPALDAGGSRTIGGAPSAAVIAIETAAVARVCREARIGHVALCVISHASENGRAPGRAGGRTTGRLRRAWRRWRGPSVARHTLRGVVQTLALGLD